MRQLSILDYLLENEIAFVLIDGVAAVAHGSSQLTRDLDICVPLDTDNFLRLQAALGPLHPRVRAGKERRPLDLDATTAGRLRNPYILTDEGNLDCLGEVAGVGDYGAAMSQSVEIEIDSRKCHVLSLEGLIRSKETMGRPRDLLAATELRAILSKTKRNE